MKFDLSLLLLFSGWTAAATSSVRRGSEEGPFEGKVQLPIHRHRILEDECSAISTSSSYSEDLYSSEDEHDYTGVKITNLSYSQPFGGSFLVVVHKKSAPALFELGKEASDGLRDLAENGSTKSLVEAICDHEGPYDDKVGYVASVGSPIGGGESLYFNVPNMDNYDYLTVASMAVNTNDCFVGFNRLYIDKGDTHYGPGYDAGTEANNEECDSLPGPACKSDSGNDEVEDGAEGFVHIHRGVHGIGDLDANVYDWRNPMIRLEFTDPFDPDDGDSSD